MAITTGEPSDPAVEEYLASLDAAQREAIEAVRRVILDRVPPGIVERFDFGMLTYVVPLTRYADTYNGRPLMHCALAAQKRHMSVYLMGIYGDADLKERFEQRYRATGKRYDVGASCVRFRRLDDLPLDVVGDAIAAVSVDDLCRMHDGARSLRSARRGKGRT